MSIEHVLGAVVVVAILVFVVKKFKKKSPAGTGTGGVSRPGENTETREIQ